MRSGWPDSKIRWRASCRRGNAAAWHWPGCTVSEAVPLWILDEPFTRSTCAASPISSALIARHIEKWRHGGADDAPRKCRWMRRVASVLTWAVRLPRPLPRRGCCVLNVPPQCESVRELLLAARQKADVLNTLFFFVRP